MSSLLAERWAVQPHDQGHTARPGFRRGGEPSLRGTFPPGCGASGREQVFLWSRPVAAGERGRALKLRESGRPQWPGAARSPVVPQRESRLCGLRKPSRAVRGTPASSDREGASMGGLASRPPSGVKERLQPHGRGMRLWSDPWRGPKSCSLGLWSGTVRVPRAGPSCRGVRAPICGATERPP